MIEFFKKRKFTFKVISTGEVDDVTTFLNRDEVIIAFTTVFGKENCIILKEEEV